MLTFSIVDSVARAQADAAAQAEAQKQAEEAAAAAAEAEAAAVVKKYVKCIGDDVNVRSTNSTDGDVLGKAKKGYMFEKVEDVDDWTHIKYKDQDGYMKTEFLQEISEEEYNEGGLEEETTEENKKDEKKDEKKTEEGNTEGATQTKEEAEKKAAEDAAKAAADAEKAAQEAAAAQAELAAAAAAATIDVNGCKVTAAEYRKLLDYFDYATANHTDEERKAVLYEHNGGNVLAVLQLMGLRSFISFSRYANQKVASLSQDEDATFCMRNVLRVMRSRTPTLKHPTHKETKMLIDDIRKIARQAGDILLAASDPKVKEKSGHANFCTETDEKIQEFLEEQLAKILPEAEFLGEEEGQDEFTEKMKHGYVFVLDPIDGTSNFIYSYRPSVISIGLLRDGKPYIGVVYDPFSDEMFHATAGGGAYLNDERIMSSDASLSETLAVFGTAPYYDGLPEKAFEMASKLMPQCVDIRRSGTAAYDFCCVAAGRCGLYFELRIQLWDYAAASLIATEAGCSVTDAHGKPLSYTGCSSVICRSRGVTKIPDCLLIR